MKLVLRILLLSSLSTFAIAAPEKTKSPDVNSYPFWTGGKKAGGVPQLAPGLNTVLQLSDAQKAQIASAREEMMNDEAMKAGRGLSKSDPNVTPEQREKARAAMDAANSRLRERVGSILNPDQKALIEKINAAYAAAIEETGIVYSDKFASPSVKTDQEARRRLQEEKNQDLADGFLHKLDAILSPAQKEAMSRAAAEEDQRKSVSSGLKKPVKE